MGLTKQEKARREAQIVKEIARDPKAVPATMGGMKAIELPDARKLSDLFREMRPADLTKLESRPGEYFCTANPVGHWYVEPTSAVKAVLDGMSRLGIHFKITMRRTGTALVSADYDRIIGGRWLAVIDGAKVRTASKQGGT